MLGLIGHRENSLQMPVAHDGRENRHCVNNIVWGCKSSQFNSP